MEQWRMAQDPNVIDNPQVSWIPLISPTRIHFFSFFLSLFTYFERERESVHVQAQVGEGRERGEKESQPGSVCTINAESHAGLELTNCGIMTWTEINSRTLNWATLVPRESISNIHCTSYQCTNLNNKTQFLTFTMLINKALGIQWDIDHKSTWGDYFWSVTFLIKY